MSNAYEKIFTQAADMLRARYKEQGKEMESALWFNMRYIGLKARQTSCRTDDTGGASDNGGKTIEVGVQNAFMWRMMEDKGFVADLTNALSSISGEDITLSPSFTGEAIRQEKVPDERGIAKGSNALDGISAGMAVSSGYDRHPIQAGMEAPFLPPHPSLQNRFTFDQFVAGENSEYAYNVCMASAKEPGTKFNPILLYGGVGLGKTHLMQAIGNYIYTARGGKVKIVCVSAEQFGTDYTTAMRVPRLPKNIDRFKDKYRNCDVLLLDDIHFLQGKSGMQDELFYTFNALREKNRQMVFTCDRPIAQLEKIVDRLASRLSNGQCVDLRTPSYEVRIAILQKKLSSSNILEKKDIVVAPGVVDYIAAIIETNVRDLESALNKVLGYAEMTKKKVDVSLAQYLLRDMNVQRQGNITIEGIQKAVAEDYNVTVQELKGKKRDRRLAYPRQVACYLCRELTEAAFSDIGHEFGGRDHATIMHACDVIGTDRKLDGEIDDRIERLIERLRRGDGRQ